jgi:8-oxo-dGTP pyrophosphatase MutT (NUDIX family)
VLPVDRAGRVLLLLGRDLLRQGERFWMSVGGAVERGESLAQAAARELREETGISAHPVALGSPVGTSAIEFTSLRLLPVTQHLTYFAVAVDDTPVTFDGQGMLERLTIVGYEWLSPEDLRRRPERLGDPELPRMLGVAVAAVRDS